MRRQWRAIGTAEGGKAAPGWGGALAVLWGFAEATVFFIVPDVLLSAVAVTSLRRALRLLLLALAGAVAGGAAMLLWARAAPEAAAGLVLAVPGISPDLVARAQELTAQGLLGGMIVGALSGIPYKIFAVEAGRDGLGLGAFVAVSLPARGLRFLAVVLLTAGLSRTLFRGLVLRAKLAVLAMVWVGFYAVYFAVMGW